MANENERGNRITQVHLEKMAVKTEGVCVCVCVCVYERAGTESGVCHTHIPHFNLYTVKVSTWIVFTLALPAAIII